MTLQLFLVLVVLNGVVLMLSPTIFGYFQGRSNSVYSFLDRRLRHLGQALVIVGVILLILLTG